MSDFLLPRFQRLPCRYHPLQPIYRCTPSGCIYNTVLLSTFLFRWLGANISPLLLNTYTWCSRGDEAGAIYETFRGKVAIVLSSPGAMGCLRTLNPHREILTNLGVNAIPQSVAIGAAFKAFDGEGNLVDDKQKSMLEGAIEGLFYLARDQANRDATCALVKKVIAGEYGAVSLPQGAGLVKRQ